VHFIITLDLHSIAIVKFVSPKPSVSWLNDEATVVFMGISFGTSVSPFHPIRNPILRYVKYIFFKIILENILTEILSL
jgi:hypothetical protein